MHKQGATHMRRDAELRENAEALRTVDFNMVPNYQVMKRVYHQLVSQHGIGGDLAAEVAAGMQINVNATAMSDQEGMDLMIESTCVSIGRLYRQLGIDFGSNRAGVMLSRLAHQFSISYTMP